MGGKDKFKGAKTNIEGENGDLEMDKVQDQL